MVAGEARTGLTDLPPPARRLVGGTVALAAVLAIATVLTGGGSPSPLVLFALAAGIAAGEGLRIDLPFRKAGTAQFNLSDAALTVGLLLLPPSEVVVAACLGKLSWQLVDRVPGLKIAFNLSWYVAGTSLAALVVQSLAARPGPVDTRTTVAVGLGLCVLTAVNTVAVSGIIALSGNQSWLVTAGRILPTLSLLTVSNAGLGLLGVLLTGTHPWALVALAIPVALLYAASREQVHAMVDRERSDAVIRLEHRLSDAAEPSTVAAVLAAGVGDVLGLRAAVWCDGTWLTPPPQPAADCEHGPPGMQRAPLGTRGGLLVAWPGELGITPDSVDWLGRLARSGGVHLDRAAAHTALEQERATLRAVVDGTRDGIFLIDEHGTVLVWNPAMARLALRPPHLALGRAAAELLGPGPWQTAGVHDVVRPGAGQSTWRLSVASVRDASHGSLHVAVVHDVTAERRVARMKDDMLAVVSHELRTPLTPIKASAQLLRTRGDGLGNEQRMLLLSQIEGRADHLTRLVEDLLLVGQLSADRTAATDGATATTPTTTIEPTDVDLSCLLGEEVAQLALSRTTHALECSAPDPVPAVTDPRRIRQIVDNLVENACKFSPPGTTVSVMLHADDRHATVAVRDQGRGIPPADLERILEPFERGDDPLHMTTSGAGLGLFIVRELVNALGGRLVIDSAPGLGTTVTVTLPLQPPGDVRRRRASSTVV